MVLSNVSIYGVDVPSSHIVVGDVGFSIVASGISCNVSLNWSYDYYTWLVPYSISDHGEAYVQVEAMDVGISLGLENQEGSLAVVLKECGSYIKSISIKLDGENAWIYQGVLDTFDEQIRSAVEDAITKNLEEGISKFNLFMQSLPKEIPVDEFVSLNVTFVNGPLLSNSSVEFEIDGLFTENKKSAVSGLDYMGGNSEVVVPCQDSSQMLAISLDEAVFNSASSIYYNAGLMQWVLDKLPDQTLLNTAGWRFIVPQLYKKYPNDDMNMNIVMSFPPVIKILWNRIDAAVDADLIIDVLENNNVIPVACISLTIHGSGSVKVVKNNLAGNVKLDDLAMSLKWSKIGSLHMYLIQPVVWTVIETAVLPNVNSRDRKSVV